MLSADCDAEVKVITNDIVVQYAARCTNNFSSVNPNKFKHFAFNSYITFTINDQILSNPVYVKYFVVDFSNQVCWKYQVNHKSIICSKKISDAFITQLVE